MIETRLNDCCSPLSKSCGGRSRQRGLDVKSQIGAARAKRESLSPNRSWSRPAASCKQTNWIWRRRWVSYPIHVPCRITSSTAIWRRSGLVINTYLGHARTAAYDSGRAQTPLYDGAHDVDHRYAISRATLPDFPERILQGRPSGCIHLLGYEQIAHALLCRAVSRGPSGGCRNQALPRQTSNDSLKPANACTCGRYPVRPGFIIRSCSPARPEGDRWRRAHGTAGDNGGERSQAGAR